MVQINRKYTVCGHTLFSVQTIPDYRQVKAQSEKKVGFFRSLFCVSPKSAKKSHITKEQVVKQNVIGDCPACEAKRAAMAYKQESQRYNTARREHNHHQSSRRVNTRLSERQRAFRCSACRAEDRRSQDRSANGGLCCARGQEEWDRLGYGKPTPTESYTNTSRPVPVSSDRQPLIRKMTSTEAARRDASEAAKSYGWKRNPDEFNVIQPEVIADFLNVSGGTIDSLPQLPTPLYMEPGIDWDTWSSFPQTPHGRIPPAPMRHLPTPPRASQQPFRPSSKKASRGPSREPSKKSRSQSRQPPVKSSIPQPPRVYREEPPTVRPLTRHPREREQPQPSRPLKSAISKLGDDIDGVLEFWENSKTDEDRHWRR